MSEEQNRPPKKRDEALPERLFRRMLEGVGDVVDRKFGRTIDPRSGLTTSKLINRMKRLIDHRVRDHQRSRIAPHHLKLKIEWGTHSEAPDEIIKQLENEILAAAIDHINDHRYNTLAPVQIESEVDIFTQGISVEPNFGEFEEELRQEDEEKHASRSGKKGRTETLEVSIEARVSTQDSTRDIALRFKPGGKRLNVGRAADNDISLNDNSVSKIHAALVMNSEGTLLVADTGSTNGTFINGRRISYGDARPIEAGDVVSFGDVEVRFRRSE